jgi:hypothetical protein
MNLKTATDRLKKHGVKGFHSFRRFRITRLRERAIPEDIVRFWAGHTGQSISDRYSKLAQNAELRKKYAGPDEAGLGFDIPKTPKKPKRSLISSLELVTPQEPAYTSNDQDLDEFFYSTPVVEVL